MIFTILLYGIVFLLVLLSFLRDRKKTSLALLKAWKAFNNILPQFLGIIVLVGILISVFNAQTISRILGQHSGWFGVTLAAMVGSITIIPGFIAFPAASLLLQNGAGYMQIGAFVSTLMMVGVVTFPVERKYFGVKTAVLRNSFALAFSFLVAFVIKWVFSW